ncbi:hypothetical protein R1flu_021376 [Riccia fluitans]|uniref:LAGLIDADG homing endonuclease n=1 Tax=Riccia fluitans TaxID=41844 RepID=A0ABD1ZP73_9MARC
MRIMRTRCLARSHFLEQASHFSRSTKGDQRVVSGRWTGAGTRAGIEGIRKLKRAGVSFWQRWFQKIGYEGSEDRPASLVCQSVKYFSVLSINESNWLLQNGQALVELYAEEGLGRGGQQDGLQLEMLEGACSNLVFCLNCVVIRFKGTKERQVNDLRNFVGGSREEDHQLRSKFRSMMFGG